MSTRLRDAFDRQGTACHALGSPFMARLMPLIGARLSGDTTIAAQYFAEDTRTRVSRTLEDFGAKATPDAPLLYLAMEVDANTPGAALTATLRAGGAPSTGHRRGSTSTVRGSTGTMRLHLGKALTYHRTSPPTEGTAPMPIDKDPSLNVLGEALALCSTDPMTGFFREGSCDTCAQDGGSHTVCCVMTAEFLAYSKYVGNDLSTPRPEYGFPGLTPGDGWCVCASRWMQAAEEGAAPLVNMAATHQRALDVIPLATLQDHAIGPEGQSEV